MDGQVATSYLSWSLHVCIVRMAKVEARLPCQERLGRSAALLAMH